MDTPPKIFEAGSVQLQSGVTLAETKLAYQTYGTLNKDGDNALVHPTWYGGRHTDVEWLIGPGRPLDTNRFFVIVPNLFGNGLSSSPSTQSDPWGPKKFPRVSLYDNVVCQHRLITEILGVTRIRLVTGWSMAAMQTFQWGCLFPDLIDNLAPSCGAARCSPHNSIMLNGLRAALTADRAFNGDTFRSPPTRGVQAMARVYASWGTGQAFFSEESYKDFGFSSAEDYVQGFWGGFLENHHPNDLLSMIDTWNCGDISANSEFHGNFENALGAIRAKTIVLAGKTDLYFPPEDSEYEVAHIPDAELRIFHSNFGHLAAGWLNPSDVQLHELSIRELLESY